VTTKGSGERLVFSILFLLFALVCAGAASISAFIGSYTSYLFFGIAIWLTVAIGVQTYSAFRKRTAKVV
jgi:hypothetical protein